MRTWFLLQGADPPVDTSVGAPQESVKTAEAAPATATVLCSEAVHGTVADYNLNYANCSNVRWFDAVFSDGRNPIV